MPVAWRRRFWEDIPRDAFVGSWVMWVFSVSIVECVREIRGFLYTYRVTKIKDLLNLTISYTFGVHLSRSSNGSSERIHSITVTPLPLYWMNHRCGYTFFFKLHEWSAGIGRRRCGAVENCVWKQAGKFFCRHTELVHWCIVTFLWVTTARRQG